MVYNRSGNYNVWTLSSVYFMFRNVACFFPFVCNLELKIYMCTWNLKIWLGLNVLVTNNNVYFKQILESYISNEVWTQRWCFYVEFWVDDVGLFQTRIVDWHWMNGRIQLNKPCDYYDFCYLVERKCYILMNN